PVLNASASAILTLGSRLLSLVPSPILLVARSRQLDPDSNLHRTTYASLLVTARRQHSAWSWPRPRTTAYAAYASLNEVRARVISEQAALPSFHVVASCYPRFRCGGLDRP